MKTHGSSPPLAGVLLGQSAHNRCADSLSIDLGAGVGHTRLGRDVDKSDLIALYI